MTDDEKEKLLREKRAFFGGMVMPPLQLMPDFAGMQQENVVENTTMNRQIKVDGQRGTVLPQNAVPPPAPPPPTSAPGGKPDGGTIIPSAPAPPPVPAPTKPK